MLLSELADPKDKYEILTESDNALYNIDRSGLNIYEQCIKKINNYIKDPTLSWCGCVNIFKAIDSNNPLYLHLIHDGSQAEKFTPEEILKTVRYMCHMFSK
jgi:hypothetical protein